MSMKFNWSMTPSPSVLVAEDDDDIRAMVAAALRPNGYEVIEAKNGAELLDHVASSILFCERQPPDLIISDIRMPGFSGLEILAGLRGSKHHTPFVLMTAYCDEATRRDARRYGANGIFAKPFDVEDLKTLVEFLVPIEAFEYLKWPPPSARNGSGEEPPR